MTDKTESRWEMRQTIDWERFPAVVFESDDWGACEVARDAEDAAALQPLWDEVLDRSRPILTTLESPSDLAWLYDVLESVKGADGLPAVFTAFTCTGNPDFEAIRRAGEYCDIGIDEGVPAGWERGDLRAAWRDGLSRGVFAPEFHGNLHHTSPVVLMELLHDDGPEGRLARESFDREVYCQGRHVPEFEGMTVRDQLAWNRTGMERFRRAFGYDPACAITSDALPETEVIWSLLGIRAVCLKNCRVNSGQVVVYPTKPWNNQDPDVPLGAYDPVLDVTFMIRNVFFECAGNPDQHADSVFDIIRTRWSEGEPAMISTHRANYVSLDAERAETGFSELQRLLELLLKEADTRFLTTAEVADIYRQGWSLRTWDGQGILRVFSEDATPARLKGDHSEVRSVTDESIFEGVADGAETVLEPPVGEYRV